MAIDTQDMTDQTELPTADNAAETEPTKESGADKAKRERVELETLDPNTKVTLVLSVPAGMKLALTKAGEDQSLSATAYARQQLAEKIAYEIPDSFLEGARVKKYANDEERKTAIAQDNKDKREAVKALIAAASAGTIELPPELAAAMAKLTGK